MIGNHRRRLVSLGALACVVVLAASACGSSSKTSSSSDTSASAESGKIALLLPETKTARYETQDKPLFEAKAKELCRGQRGALQQRQSRTRPSSSRRPRRR